MQYDNLPQSTINSVPVGFKIHQCAYQFRHETNALRCRDGNT